MFIYDDRKQNSSFNPAIKVNANRQFLKHFENSLFLSLIQERGSLIEKRQAAKELDICERKMEYWKRKPEFDMKEVLPKMQELKKNWQR